MRRLALLFLIFSVLIMVSAKQEASEKVAPEIAKSLESHGTVQVIISINEETSGGILSEIKGIFTEDTLEKIKKDKETVKFSSGGMAAEINADELRDLINEDKVIYIEPVREFKILLQDSAPLINATTTWNLQVSGVNLTGINQTVCIIDTGASVSHLDLIGKNKTCNIYCSPNGDACQENCSITDLNGHGTHVAGIVAASGGISGIATVANFIPVKVFTGSSSTDANTTSVKNGIDWCVDNSELYNISVITMSLGSGLYNSYCDYNSSTLNTSFNNAFNKNISVTVATGNDGNSASISLPACLPKAIPVGAVDKNDAIYYNRNSLVKLLAPGVNINSTYNTGGYATLSGTSMATPHVAGAIAIINQFLSLTGQTKTSKEIEAALNNTGKKIQDTTGLNFSRINIYSAIISLDNLAPNVSLISPSNNQLNLSQNQTFSCNATDISLKNVSFYLWNSSSSVVNLSSQTISGSFSSVLFNITNLSYGNYNWNCLFYDENGNSAFASSNFSLTIGGILTSLISPSNNNYTNVNLTNYTCSSNSESSYSLTNVTFYLWNSSSLVYNETKNIAGTSNETVFNWTFSQETSYLWSCRSVNNVSNSSLAENFSVTYDVTKPNITLIAPYPADETSSSASKIFYYNVSDNFNISRCDLIVNNAIVLNNSNVISINNSFTKTFSPAAYSWSINCTDMAGNMDNSSTRSFTITSPPLSASGSPGGGGGAPSKPANKTTAAETELTSGGGRAIGKNKSKEKAGGEIEIEKPEAEIGKINLARYWYAGLYTAVIFVLLAAGYVLFKRFKRQLRFKVELKINKDSGRKK